MADNPRGKTFGRIKNRVEQTSDRIYALTMILVIIVVGTIGFTVIEGWTPLQALYTTIITVTTVGYGDFSPKTQYGQIFAVFFTLSAIGIVSYALSTVAATVINREQNRRQLKLQEKKMKEICRLSDHVIVCGGGYLGGQVARALRRAHTPILIIEPNEASLRQALLHTHQDFLQSKLKEIKTQGFLTASESDLETYPVEKLAHSLQIPVLSEDPTLDNTLHRAGIERAKGLVSTLGDDKDALFVVLSARQLANSRGNDRLNIVARISDENSRNKMIAAGANRVMSLAVAGGIQMSTAVLSPDISDFWLEVFFKDDVPVRFSTLNLSDQPELVGQTVDTVSKNRACLVVAVKRANSYQYLPRGLMVLQPGDVLFQIERE